ncbi:MAG TPA: GtrA family protein [Bacilli bacterium]|jgi:putative flippase GtrA|nr:GtrA family protein [Bacilli bacterium]
MLKKFLSNKQNQTEILRFIIVGVICTLVDFGVSSLIQFVIYPVAEALKIGPFTITPNIFLAALFGFIFGVITNYILSVIVVFKNVENKKTSRSAKGFIIFVLLSTGGFLINYAIKELGNLIIPMDTNYIWFVFIFGVATFVVLIYNYVTRKLILFKPKKEEMIKSDENTTTSSQEKE